MRGRDGVRLCDPQPQDIVLTSNDGVLQWMGTVSVGMQRQLSRRVVAFISIITLALSVALPAKSSSHSPRAQASVLDVRCRYSCYLQ